MKFEKEIIEVLLEKYHSRLLRESSNGEIRREISVKPQSICKRYGDNLEQDRLFNTAANNLADRGYVLLKKKPYSDDVEKIILVKENADQLIHYAHSAYGIVPADEHYSAEKELLKQYEGRGALTGYYCDHEIAPKLQKTLEAVDVETDEEMLRLLYFIQSNEQKLYVREVSMLVFGSSKVFETKYLQKVNTLLLTMNGESEIDDSSELLRKYNIVDVNQEILIKGNVQIDFVSGSIDVSQFKEGISFMSSDIDSIRNIKMHTNRFMTVENKTAFHRMNDEDAVYMYLGGFANHHQERFIRKVYECVAPSIQFWHFGDIDIGGFKIHQDLVRSTGVSFKLYKMGVSELQDIRYRECLCQLSDKDRINAQSIIMEPEYREVLEYMLEKNIKLEQEIIALLG